MTHPDALSAQFALVSELQRAESPRDLTRAGLMTIVLFFGLIGIWMAAAPLSGAAIGQGVVTVEMKRQIVQHQEGGTIREILVKHGSKVEAGQTLMVLQDVQVDAAGELVRHQLDAELVKLARLEAEKEGAAHIAFSKEILSRRSHPQLEELIAQERAVFRTRREALDTQLNLLKVQMDDLVAEIIVRESQLKADESALALQKEEYETHAKLASQGYISNMRLLSLQRSIAEYESRYAENRVELSRARQRMTDMKMRAASLRNNFQQEAAAELRKSVAIVAEQRERMRPAHDAEERQLIRAHISGEVVELKVTSIGAAIAPRQPLLEILPHSTELLIEARFSPDDIEAVRAGTVADVRLTAYRHRTTSAVEGTVRYVSADALTDKVDGSPYYLAHIAVPQEALERAGNLRLQAGMAAEVYVRTEPRTALAYLLEPILGFLWRSMREP